MALLAAFAASNSENLGEFLENEVFSGDQSITETPKSEDVAGFEAYLKEYRAGLGVVAAAVETL
jgi:hypothetical protein